MTPFSIHLDFFFLPSLFTASYTVNNQHQRAHD